MRRIEELIEHRAARGPNLVAVEQGATRLTYHELVERSRRIGMALREAGVTSGQTVGLYLERSPDAVAAMLGVWQAGGVVVPLSLEAPAVVLGQIVDDAALRLIVASQAQATRLKRATSAREPTCRTLLLDDLLEPASPTASRRDRRLVNEQPTERPDDCYIYYTSGSRGRPKGVEGLHSSLAHYLEWQAREFAVGEADRFSQVAPLTFDFCLKEIFVPLIRGARVVIAEREVVGDPQRLLAWVRAHRITVLCCVPTLFRAITETIGRAPEKLRRALTTLRYVLISGDLLRWEDVARWRELVGNVVPLVNLYGPTESTVIKLFYRIAETPAARAGSVPVGKPIDGADVLVLDERGQPRGPREPGEIVILSDWIAKGYRNGEQREPPAFTHVRRDGAWVRAYRTGDLGRLRPDGNLEIVGRLDRQIKVRGQRVELDAIEAVLAEHPDLGDVAVVTAGTGDALTIVCYYTCAEGAPSPAALRVFARERLLPAAVPGRFVRLDALPLSANGKVDRAALATVAGLGAPAGERDGGGSGQATLEARVLAGWRAVLELAQVGPEDNFFDLGGDSISAIRLLNHLRREVRPDIDLTDVFHHPTVSDFSAWLAARATLPAEATPIPEAPGSGRP